MHTQVSTVLALLIATFAPAGAMTGREVIDAAQKKHGFSSWRDRTVDATMETYTTSLQRSRDAKITEQSDPRGEHRTLMEFIGPTDVAGTLFLHLSPRGDKDQQWLWSPQTRRARRLGDAQRDDNFFGTDLTYRDLELLVRIQQWNDDESTATLVREDMVDGRTCHLVELVPKNKEFPYARYRLWFGTDDLLLWQVEIDDLDGTLLKRVKPSGYERVQDYMTASKSEVTNVRAATHTRFKLSNVRYDSGVADDLFSVSTVQKGR